MFQSFLGLLAHGQERAFLGLVQHFCDRKVVGPILEICFRRRKRDHVLPPVLHNGPARFFCWQEPKTS